MAGLHICYQIYQWVFVFVQKSYHLLYSYVAVSEVRYFWSCDCCRIICFRSSSWWSDDSQRHTCVGGHNVTGSIVIWIPQSCRSCSEMNEQTAVLLRDSRVGHKSPETWFRILANTVCWAHMSHHTHKRCHKMTTFYFSYNLVFINLQQILLFWWWVVGLCVPSVLQCLQIGSIFGIP